MKARALILGLLLLAAVSCSRTVYTNLHPQRLEPTPPQPASREAPRYWQHFFLFGWVPGERLIDAETYCHGTEHVERIETRLSFVQGLITSLAGFYINVYAPYTGRVVCDYHVED